MIDFGDTIARFNVEHSREFGGEGVPFDVAYTRELGRDAIPALDEFLTAARDASPDLLKQVAVTREDLAGEMIYDRDRRGGALLRPVDWQSWTWADQRLRDYVQAHPFAPDPIVVDK